MSDVVHRRGSRFRWPVDSGVLCVRMAGMESVGVQGKFVLVSSESARVRG